MTVQDWREAGLSIPCKVGLKLFTLDDALILHKAGSLPEQDAEPVKRNLARFLAMDTDAEPRTLESLRGMTSSTRLRSDRRPFPCRTSPEFSMRRHLCNRVRLMRNLPENGAPRRLGEMLNT